ncbi:hypothetical protein HMPREF1484_01971 [Dermabacter sp. HFH0086]|uniref:hypothetical protein n=1 Tax=Dermabacter TaxID=36739 RepID=UPI000353AB64|nr:MULTISPECIES: hypothetical protein [Dermabacter]EPH14662.1 hypothetical protein HMPREF1484_01971 [Dermabacter sp. HFH0086]
MVKRTNLKPSPERALADLTAKLAAKAQQVDTRPAGIKDLGEHGDVIWQDTNPETGAPRGRSVRRFAVELDSTVERAAALEKRLADSEAELDEAREGLANLRDKELPALKEQLANVGDVDFSEFDAKIAAAEAQIAATEQAWKDAVEAERTDREQADGNLGERIDGVFRNMTVTDTSYLSNAVIGELAARIAKVIELEASRITAGEIGAGQINVVELAGEVARFISLDLSQLRVTDKTELNEAVAQAIASRTAEFQKAFIQNLRTNGAAIDEAVIGDLAANIITSGLFRTAKEGQRIEIDSNGFTSYGVDDEGNDMELVKIARDGTATIDTGKASMDADGGVTGLEGRFEKLWVAGRELSDVVADGPRGVVAWGRRSTNTNFRKSLTRVLEVWTTLQPGRLYRISSSPFRVDVNSNPTQPVWARLEYFEVPYVSDDKIYRLNTFPATTSTWEHVVPGMYSTFATGPSGLNLTEPKDYSFLVRTESPSAYHRAVLNGLRADLVIEDIGPDIEESGQAWDDPEEKASTPTPPPPPPPPVKTKRHASRKATACATYYRGGSRQSGKNDATQGYYSRVGNREGIWLFGNMPGELSGSKVERVRLGFWVAHTYNASGGVAHFHLHGRSSFGNTAGLSRYVGSRNVKRNSWVTFDITDPGICAGFANGTYKGFGISTNSTGRNEYIRGNPDATLEIDYWK